MRKFSQEMVHNNRGSSNGCQSFSKIREERRKTRPKIRCRVGLSQGVVAVVQKLSVDPGEAVKVQVLQ